MCGRGEAEMHTEFYPENDNRNTIWKNQVKTISIFVRIIWLNTGVLYESIWIIGNI
jgi:hypothetical protein